MNIMEYMQMHKEEYINDLKGLIQIPSLKDESTVEEQAPFGKGCRQALDYMLHLASLYGFEVLDYDGYAGVISYGEQSESIGMLAHLDVVPVEEEGWMVPPFSAEIVNGVMISRGVMDDKGAAMSGLYALRYLRENNIQLNKKILLILGCDEESGMQCMEYYKQNGGEIPSCGFTPDASFPLIYGEKGGLHIVLKGMNESCVKSLHGGQRANVVIPQANAYIEGNMMLEPLLLFYAQCHDLKAEIKEEGLQAEVKLEGVGAHGARPYAGKNAGVHLMRFLGEALNDDYCKTLSRMLEDWMGSGLGIAFEGDTMGFLTMNPGIIHMDEQVEVVIDIRYPNDIDADTIIQSIQQAIDESGLPLELEVKKNVKPLYVDPNSEFIQTLLRSYKQFSGDYDSKPFTIGGGTYAKKFANFVAFGPEFPHPSIPKGMQIGECHQTNEGMAIEDLIKAVAIYSDALIHLGGLQHANA